MPRKPEWLQNLTSAIQELQSFHAPVVDRATLEKLLQVRRQAIRLMHRFGGYQASRTFLIDRSDLLQQFEAIAAGKTHQREIQRRQRLVASLKPRKTIRVATDVWERKLTELPQEPVLGPESWRLSLKTPINSLAPA